ncbi:MAG: hypothetical protein KBA51_03215 [Kiritimatiellae bacterium]|nr:hypothetical protein [Kiritimatiellia bacterium]
MNLEPMVRKALVGKAIPDVLIAVLFGAIGSLCLWLMFLIGTWIGPFILWFIEPVPAYMPTLSGIILLAVSIVSALRADQKYWTSFTYDSKSLGEIPFSEAPWKMHRFVAYNVPLVSLGLPVLPGAGLPADMQVLGPASVNMMTKIISIPLLIGPILVLSAIRSAKEACRLITADTRHLASLLALIYSQGGRVSFEAISQAEPGFQPVRDGKMLLLIDGVVLVQKEMHGIALADRLEERIRLIAEQ